MMSNAVKNIRERKSIHVRGEVNGPEVSAHSDGEQLHEGSVSDHYILQAHHLQTFHLEPKHFYINKIIGDGIYWIPEIFPCFKYLD